MKVLSLVYATDQGLGILAKSFYDHGIITHPLVVRHGRHLEHDEWYPDAPRIGNVRDLAMVQQLVKAVAPDVALFLETPFLWELIPYCQQLGIKTVLMPMYECEPEHLPYEPDRFINPSLLDQRYFPKGTFIPVPVEVPWRLRKAAHTFIHNAGHGGLRGRNGTRELLDALPLVRSPARFLIRTQELHSEIAARCKEMSNRVDIVYQPGTIPYDQLWDAGDVFLFPEKFNGLSLPLQEAYASGMLVMCGDRFPMNTWLPRAPLIPVERYVRSRIGPPYLEFDEARFSSEAIAAKVDEWYGRDILEFSVSGKEWALRHSWDVLKPLYLEALA